MIWNFWIGGCEEVWSSIFWAQRRGKREHQMKGCAAEQKVSDWQMNVKHQRPNLYVSEKLILWATIFRIFLLIIRVYLHSFSRCCLPNLRNHARFRENSNL